MKFSSQELQLFKLAEPYLKKGIKKDFVLHTEGVAKAMKLILERVETDHKTMMAAAILHDVGWANVPVELQKSSLETDLVKGLRQHIELAPPIISKILKTLDYQPKQTTKIIDIVKAHKFCKPRSLEKRLLIDADQVADSFSEQFWSDVKSYSSTPDKLWRFRMQDNQFYTSVAKELFTKEMMTRKLEIV